MVRVADQMAEFNKEFYINTRNSENINYCGTSFYQRVSRTKDWNVCLMQDTLECFLYGAC